MTSHSYTFHIICNVNNVSADSITEESVRQDIQYAIMDLGYRIGHLDALESSPDAAVRVYVAKETKTSYYAPTE